MIINFISKKKKELLSVVIRGSTLLGKLLQTVVLAKWLTLYDVGTLGILTVTIAFSIAFLGLDFFYYSGRELLKSDESDRPSMLRDQFIFHCIISLVSLPCLLILFYSGKFQWSLIYYFYFILIAEHIGQESYRMLILLKKPLEANICLFLRHGVWIFMMLIAMFTGVIDKTLYNVLLFWSIGGVLSLLYSIYVFSSWEWSKVRESSINWQWIKKGIPYVALYLLITQSLRAVSLIDRYFLDHLLGRDSVAVYVFYYGLAVALATFIDAGIVSHKSPYILEHTLKKEYSKAMSLTKQLCKSILIASFGLALIAVALIYPLLYWIDKAEYSSHVDLFVVTIFAVLVGVFANIPSNLLYGLGKDKVTCYVSIAGVFLFGLLSYIFISMFGLIGAPVSMLVYNAVLLCVRQVLVNKYVKAS